MKMGGFQIRGMIVAALVVVVTIITISEGVAAEVHHVVGGDRGWDTTSDLVSWSSGRVFRVGDQIWMDLKGYNGRTLLKRVAMWHWFTYSVAQGVVAELKSREEYESCDVNNPIMMYTEGLHSIPLEREGIRYFVSTEPENCKNGLKLHVEVMPKDSPITLTYAAAGPTTPSGSARYGPNIIFGLMLVVFCVTIGLAY